MQFIDLAAQQARIKPQIDANIQKVLSHGQYILGPEVAELEDKLKAYCGAKHCIGVANGTDALQIALMALGLGFLLRSTAGTITVIVSLLFIISTPLQIAASKWDWIYKIIGCLPSTVSEAVSDPFQRTTEWGGQGAQFLTHGQAIAVFAAWAIVPLLIAWFVFSRRDA